MGTSFDKIYLLTANNIVSKWPKVSDGKKVWSITPRKTPFQASKN